jgi:ATP-binding cassette subfamily B protein
MAKKTRLKQIISNNIWILRYVFKYAPLLVVEQILQIVVMCISTYITINVTKWILDKVDSGWKTGSIILFIIGIFSISILSNFLIAFFETHTRPQNQVKLSTEIRKEMISKIRRIDQIKFQNSDFFNHYNMALDQIDVRAYSALASASNLLRAFINVVIVAIVAGSINSAFAVIGCTSACIDSILGVVYQKIEYSKNLEFVPDGRRRGYINRITYAENFVVDLKVFPRFLSLVIYKYQQATSSVLKIMNKYARKQLLLNQAQQIPDIIFRYILPWAIIVVLLKDGAISIPEATVLTASALSLPNALSEFLKNISHFYIHSKYVQSMRAIMEHTENIEKDARLEWDATVPFSLKLDNVSYAYPPGDRLTIDGISMDVKKGDKIALVGYNGAGKTTLVKLMEHLYDITAGSIVVNGSNITEIKAESLRSKIAYLSQNQNVYSFSVAENILMRPVNGDADVKTVWDALDKVGLYEKVSSWKNGIHTSLTKEFDEDGEYLSGGELQKLSLARIYAGDYECILLDEATSALDPISEEEILRTVFDIFSDKTVIVISHRLAVVSYIDRICFMANGKCVETGTHQELMDLQGEYHDFFMTQAKKYEVDK